MKLFYDNKKFYNHIEEWIGGILLAIMLVLLFVQVVIRYIFKASAAWISEYCLYMFMYFTFLACSGGFLRNDHIQILAVVNLLPKKARDVLYLFLQIVCCAFSCFIGYHTLLRVLDQIHMNTLSVTQFPMWIMSASLLVGMAGSAIRCLVNVYFQIRYVWLHPGSKEETGS